jgi:hypothetical protein
VPAWNRRSVLALLVASLPWLTSAPAAAQDPFEIEVYGHETAARGEWELETHLNYTARGTTTYDGGIAPTEHQTHLALELTRGLTDHWEVAVYALAAHRPGTGVEYAGWRVRSRVRSPESWRLPIDLGLGAELEFPTAPYDENAAGLEIRPILARRFGRVEVRFNPIVERGLRGRDTSSASGWEFKPCARVGATVSRAVVVSLEYYGKTGFWSITLPSNERVHQFYPSVDWIFGEDRILSAGVGFGTTSAGNRLVFNSRLEVPLGK